ncbi:MAG: acylphosphatase [Betaproteobacteria bacterium]|jgi:acylphosphatase|nr:MAG: acylphosphatase [Betaproteobacteria bacterium]
MVTKHLRIHGRVQGVYFRDSMRQQARQLGVTGWVRNRLDGTVEALVSGEPQAIAKIIEWARHGPATAKVTDVQIEETQGQFDSFDLLLTS